MQTFVFCVVKALFVFDVPTDTTVISSIARFFVALFLSFIFPRNRSAFQMLMRRRRWRHVIHTPSYWIYLFVTRISIISASFRRFWTFRFHVSWLSAIIALARCLRNRNVE